jgi:type I restriction enzyme R subunit
VAEEVFFAELGVAIRESRPPGHGFAEYALCRGKAAGAIEEKAEGTALSGVEIQSDKHGHGLPETLPGWRWPISFITHMWARKPVFPIDWARISQRLGRVRF